MNPSPAVAPATPPPDAVLIQLIFGKMTFFSLAAVARLGIADHLSETPRDIEDIARDTATHAPSLYRVLRLLASVGVFTPALERQLTPVHSVRLLSVFNVTDCGGERVRQRAFVSALGPKLLSISQLMFFDGE